ncbi:hypothetical protein AVEN_5410-1 [Araneus ventricosus]|uniref:Uncharacterized protein n=1 Tax=Araneus ventricosus TaxID=182803 RepID=A0A4Y2M375_ARAVE|nr:hypothetical protein AVEN_5410-1 [Araneus ventricosus]
MNNGDYCFTNKSQSISALSDSKGEKKESKTKPNFFSSLEVWREPSSSLLLSKKSSFHPAARTHFPLVMNGGLEKKKNGNLMEVGDNEKFLCVITAFPGLKGGGWERNGSNQLPAFQLIGSRAPS